jgi:stress-induced morphogen
MAIPQSELTQILQQNFPNAQIKISSLVDDNDHYSLEITDESFRGLSLINQHKLVKNALAELLKARLHAITIKTITPK